MNNEQNNLNGLLNVNPIPASNTEPTSTMIPDQNIAPVVGNDASQVVSSTEQNATIPVAPIPGIITGNSINSELPPVNNGPVAPEISNNNVNELNGNLNQNLNIDNPTPFDIGLNSQTIPNSQPLNQNMISIDNSNQNLNNGILQPLSNNQPMNNNQTLNNNMGDATPLTNTNITDTNGEVVSVGKFLVHMLLGAIPLVGLIILLVRAFSSKSNKNISNLAKAQLLLSVIMVVLFIVISIILGATAMTMIMTINIL